MKRLIRISITRKNIVNLGTKLKDITVEDVARFNPRHAHIVGGIHDIMTDAFLMLLSHPEFPEVQEACLIPMFSIDAARGKYPYLFNTDTNPLLYRKFQPEQR